jgi:hypothetical protein
MKLKSKPYKAYLLDSELHNRSIMSKYGMPTKAKPPQDKEMALRSSDRQFRASYSKFLYMKKGGSFNGRSFK